LPPFGNAGGEFGDERIEPPIPMSIGSVPQAAGTRPGGAVDRAGASMAVRLTTSPGVTSTMCTPGNVVFQMARKQIQVRGLVAARGHPHAYLGRGRRNSVFDDAAMDVVSMQSR